VNELKLTPKSISTPSQWGIVETCSEQHKVPGYRFYPDKVKGEGFFVACFVQEGNVDEYYNVHSLATTVSRNEQAIVESFIDKTKEVVFNKQGETVIGFQSKYQQDVATVLKMLKVRKSGVAVGSIKGKDLIPHHELALSDLVSREWPCVEMDYHNALNYLKKKDLSVAVEGKGWMLGQYQGLNLGWMKVLQNRINNYYPTDWRILKD
jgi:NOL1/NOP2/fmu family ribosome biogenesis protein